MYDKSLLKGAIDIHIHVGPEVFSPSRANSLMPFVTTRFSSDAAATTSPPGQTQNENTPRPFSV